MTGRQARLSVYRELRRKFRPTRSDFERLVAEAMDSLPKEFRERLANVAVTVAEWPSDDQQRSAKLDRSDDLLGLYQGTPIGDRGGGYHLVPPDRITIYRQPILAVCTDEAELREEVRVTVLHEVGHYFGLSDHELH